jgi:hypothetical protein
VHLHEFQDDIAMDDPKRDQDRPEGDELDAPDALQGIPGELGSDIVGVEEEGVDEDDIDEDDVDDDDIYAVEDMDDPKKQ